MLSVMLVIVCFVWCQVCVRQARIRPASAQWVSSWMTALQLGVLVLIFLVVMTGVRGG
jgi:hypothetical protein